MDCTVCDASWHLPDELVQTFCTATKFKFLQSNDPAQSTTTYTGSCIQGVTCNRVAVVTTVQLPVTKAPQSTWIAAVPAASHMCVWGFITTGITAKPGGYLQHHEHGTKHGMHCGPWPSCAAAAHPVKRHSRSHHGYQTTPERPHLLWDTQVTWPALSGAGWFLQLHMQVGACYSAGATAC